MAPSSDPASALSALGKPTYFVAFLLVAISLFDYAATVLPAQLGDPGWRYGSIGILSGFLLTPLLGLVLALALAALLGHRGLLKALAILSLVAGLLGLVLLVGFLLDSVQVNQNATAEQKSLATIGVVKATIKLVTADLALIWLGIAALLQARTLRSRSPRDGGDNRVLA